MPVVFFIAFTESSATSSNREYSATLAARRNMGTVVTIAATQTIAKSKVIIDAYSEVGRIASSMR